MLKKFILYILVVFVVMSCYNVKKPEKPSRVLSKKEMVNIILDLRLLASANGSNQKILQDYGIYSEDYVYEKYKIDSSTFVQNNSYYAFYIEDYDEIYNKVRDSLDALKEYYDQLVIEEAAIKRKNDSIKNLRKRDSIKNLKREKPAEIKQNIKSKLTLIEPVSDTIHQPL